LITAFERDAEIWLSVPADKSSSALSCEYLLDDESAIRLVRELDVAAWQAYMEKKRKRATDP
jgi:hypothetical protein